MTRVARAADDFELPPIRYSESKPDNPIERLQARINAGTTKLEFDESHGWLRSVLRELQVPVSSQSLVFSKTSLQLHRIRPSSPRAIYFNDDAYVGFVRTGKVVEISVADPGLGTVFYTLEQEAAERPRFVRQNDECLICHGGSQNRGTPGHVIRSVYPDATGTPIFSAGSYRIDDTTRFQQRWGGWYVTGSHGSVGHLGNITYRERSARTGDAAASGQNLATVRDRFNADDYLSPHSDLVALTVLAHQSRAHNVITRASFDVRSALYREASLNRELGEPADHRWPSTNTVLDSAAAALVECFLMCEQPPLESAIAGTSGFAVEFAARGPQDAAGRSLRALDLEKRVFRYPCSFLIYTETFDALPKELLQRFWAQMDAVLLGENGPGEQTGKFSHLSAEDRTAIREILAATKPGIPPGWLER